MLIDTHAHLDFPDFANDLQDVLRRADEAEVRRVITVGTSIESSRRAIELAEKYPSVYAAIGVHPSQVDEAEDDVITPLRELAQNPRVVAIGESGLDYHHLCENDRLHRPHHHRLAVYLEAECGGKGAENLAGKGVDLGAHQVLDQVDHHERDAEAAHECEERIGGAPAERPEGDPLDEDPGNA